MDVIYGIPREWLKGGKSIELKNVRSYFGAVSLYVKSDMDCNNIEAEIICNSEERPETVEIRLPHPQKKKPVFVSGGIYNPALETVIVEEFKGQAKINLCF